MKTVKLLPITVTIAWSCFAVFPYSSQAQLPLPIAQADNSSSSGELPNNPEQMRSWKCTQGNKEVAVEAKDFPIWKEVIEATQWQCLETPVSISGGDITFSCEPDEIIGILTVVWLQGEGGKTQMQTWLNQLNDRSELVCIKDTTSSNW